MRAARANITEEQLALKQLHHPKHTGTRLKAQLKRRQQCFPVQCSLASMLLTTNCGLCRACSSTLRSLLFSFTFASLFALACTSAALSMGRMCRMGHWLPWRKYLQGNFFARGTAVCALSTSQWQIPARQACWDQCHTHPAVPATDEQCWALDGHRIDAEGR